MFTNNENVYELIEYYKNIHKYFMKNKEYIYNVLKGLENEVVIQNVEEETVEGDFSNFYFFYIQTVHNINLQRRSGLIIKKNNYVELKNDDDFLVGLNFSNIKVGSEIRIYVKTYNSKKMLYNTIITEENKHNIFLPVNNKEFFPYFLTNRDCSVIVQSNNNITKLDLIYLKLHRNFSNKFINYGNFLINLKGNTFLEFKDYNLKIRFINNDIKPNMFVFYWNLDKYYGRKIFNMYKKYKIKKQVKKLLEDNYNYYEDVSNLVCKFI